MWWPKAIITMVAALGLAACGFTPVLIDDRLDGQVALVEPKSEITFQLRNALEDRLGQSAGPLLLSYVITTDEEGLAITADQQVTRFNLIGIVRYDLRDESGDLITSGTQRSFTGYSTTGNTVTTRAARADAQLRLTVILADLIVEDLRSKALP